VTVSTDTVRLPSNDQSSALLSLLDWAYLEHWCRTLTQSYADVFVFTVPLYLPKKDLDGKWRVVSNTIEHALSYSYRENSWFQSYEVIGNKPSVGVPTHFAKVVLASRPSSPSTPFISEISTGAFVLPNAAISDDTPLKSFIAPSQSALESATLETDLRLVVEDVEKAAGIALLSDAVKRSSKDICQTSKCEVVVRRFDDAQKRVKAISAPRD
jgi:endonuclease G, mitochondrial